MGVDVCLTLTGLEGHICSSLVKGLEGHICPSVVTSWWRHCDIIQSGITKRRTGLENRMENGKENELLEDFE